jgi:aminobenzoyl-glutamate utilization protein B
MAGTAADLIRDPARIERAQAEHRQRLARQPYECPIPADIGPPLGPQGGAA